MVSCRGDEGVGKSICLSSSGARVDIVGEGASIMSELPVCSLGRISDCPEVESWREGPMFLRCERNISGIVWLTAPVSLLGERDLDVEDVLEAVPIIIP